MQNGGMLKSLLILLWIFGFVLQPWLMLSAIAIGIIGGISSRLPIRGREAPDEQSRTIDGRFPILNEDWVGALVLAIDDAEVLEVIRRHGARFRNPARYVIALGHGEYLLYAGDGELLDMCVLK